MLGTPVKNALADIVWFVHGILLFMVIIAICLPYNYIKYILVAIPIILMAWNNSNGLCPITDLENKLRGDVIGINKKDDKEFVQEILKSCGVDVSLHDIGKIWYNGAYTLWLLLFFKFLCYRPDNYQPVKLW